MIFALIIKKERQKPRVHPNIWPEKMFYLALFFGKKVQNKVFFIFDKTSYFLTEYNAMVNIFYMPLN